MQRKIAFDHLGEPTCSSKHLFLCALKLSTSSAVGDLGGILPLTNLQIPIETDMIIYSSYLKKTPAKIRLSHKSLSIKKNYM